MRVIDKCNIINEVVELIRLKAKYQKVVFCCDETSDIHTIDSITKAICKDAIVLKYYYNKQSVNTFFNMLNSGVRVVIYNITVEHFYSLQNNNTFVLNVFLLQENFILPYISNVESVYGDNLLACDVEKKDYLSILFMYQLGLHRVWSQLLQHQDVDVTLFRRIDYLVKSNGEFYNNMITLFGCLKSELDDNYKQLPISELPYYIYLQTCSILDMFKSLDYQEEEHIDFYKQNLSKDEICKAYNLIFKHNIVDLIRLNSTNLIKLTTVILNRFKILIKKYFNFKNIKLNKINKLIKKQSKHLNIDKLLYISFIFNAI